MKIRAFVLAILCVIGFAGLYGCKPVAEVRCGNGSNSMETPQEVVDTLDVCAAAVQANLQGLQVDNPNVSPWVDDGLIEVDLSNILAGLPQDEFDRFVALAQQALSETDRPAGGCSLDYFLNGSTDVALISLWKINRVQLLLQQFDVTRTGASANLAFHMQDVVIIYFDAAYVAAPNNARDLCLGMEPWHVLPE